MKKSELEKLQCKFERDIERRKRDYELRQKLKQKKFNNSIQGKINS